MFFVRLFGKKTEGKVIIVNELGDEYIYSLYKLWKYLFFDEKSKVKLSYFASLKKYYL